MRNDRFAKHRRRCMALANLGDAEWERSKAFRSCEGTSEEITLLTKAIWQDKTTERWEALKTILNNNPLG